MKYRKYKDTWEFRRIETFQQGIIMQVGRTRAHEASAVPFISNRSPASNKQPFCSFISVK